MHILVPSTLPISCRLTVARRVSLVVQDMLTLQKHLRLPPICCGFELHNMYFFYGILYVIICVSFHFLLVNLVLWNCSTALYCEIVPTVWYLGIIPTVWYNGIVPRVLYFGIVPTVWYFGIIPTVWYNGIVPAVLYFGIIPKARYF